MTEQVLIIDDDESFRFSLKDFLSNYEIEVFEAEDGRTGQDLIKNNINVQIVLLDINLPDIDGIEMISQILKIRPDMHIVIISAYTETEKIVQAIKNGAYDYVIKPIDFEVIKFTIEKIINNISVKKKLQLLENDKESIMVGASKDIQEIRTYCEKIASSDLPVLITGETGTGKEVVARTIHNLSKRKGSFVEVNCSAIPENLFESELFGHSQFSFTDAKKERTGKVRIAENGTLFLDEIGEMPLNLQPKVLRFIETKEYWPLGSDKKIKSNVRIICATNRNIKESLDKNRIRADLYYRLNALNISIPPLRNRKDDIILLAEYFLDIASKNTGKRINEISESLQNILLGYDYPGNVRELRNLIERAVIFCEGSILREDHFRGILDKKEYISAGTLALDEMEKKYILQVYYENDKNISKSAKILQLSRTTLRDKLHRYGET